MMIRKSCLILLVFGILTAFSTVSAQTIAPDVYTLIAQAVAEDAHDLDLGGLGLVELPSEIGQLTHLVRLNLAANHLSRLPPEIGQLTQLQELWLNDNPLDSLPGEIGQLTNLHYLNLTNTELTRLPDGFWALPQLRSLYLRQVPLGELPPEISQLTSLQHLDLRDMNLTTLPPELANLRDLRLLDLGGNYLETLPPVVFTLRRLEELHVHYTPLRTLPPEIGQLSNLRLLDVRHTSLTTLPPELGNLFHLKSLLLEDTQITELPVEMGFLDDLLFLWTYNTPLPYDVTPQQSPPNLAEILSEMRDQAIASGRVPPAKVQFISTYAEAPLLFYGAPVAPSLPSEPVQGMFFEDYGVNPVTATTEDNQSTFALDVDTASYTFTRSYIMDFDQLPPPEAVRPEEFINFFPMSYAQPKTGAFAIHMDGAPSPFRQNKRLIMRVGIQGRMIPTEDRDPALLIFVVDVSGSMDGAERLGRVKESLEILVKELRPDDRVGIVIYADQARVVMEPISAAEQNTILAAIDSLHTEGSTYAEAGLRLGYGMARQYMQAGQNTRVILCSDGVANVGETGPDAILETVKENVQAGITLSTVGFGMGNFNDVLMEQLANDGNGNYFYVDNLREARRIFAYNLTSTLQVIAYDARVQVVFNPDVVRTYRLIGYENRAMADEDFRKDEVDAGEVGAGHSVTALYEIELVDENQPFFNGTTDTPPPAARLSTPTVAPTPLSALLASTPIVTPTPLPVYPPGPSSTPEPDSPNLWRVLLVAVACSLIILGFAYPRWRLRWRDKRKRRDETDEYLMLILILAGATLLGMLLMPQAPVRAQENYLIATAYVRYETPDTREVEEIAHTFTLLDVLPTIDDAPADYRLVVGVAEFAELLHKSPYAADGHYSAVLELLHPLRGANEAATEVVEIIEKLLKITNSA